MKTLDLYVEDVAALLRDREDVSDVSTRWVVGVDGGWRVSFTYDGMAMSWRVVERGNHPQAFLLKRETSRRLVQAQVGVFRDALESATADRLVNVSASDAAATVDALMDAAATVRGDVTAAVREILSARECHAPLNRWVKALASAGLDTSTVMATPGACILLVKDPRDSAYIELFPNGKWRPQYGPKSWSTEFMLRVAGFVGPGPPGHGWPRLSCWCHRAPEDRVPCLADRRVTCTTRWSAT